MNSNRAQHTNQHGSIDAVFKRGWVQYKQEVRRLILGIANPLFRACQNYPDPNYYHQFYPNLNHQHYPNPYF